MASLIPWVSKLARRNIDLWDGLANNNMKTFELYLKNHCSFPDYEAEVEAETEEEAIRLFSEDPALREVDNETIRQSMKETP